MAEDALPGDDATNASAPLSQDILIAALTDLAARSYPDPLEKPYDALRLVIKFVEHGDRPRSVQAAEPLRALLIALSDRLNGGDPALLKSRKRARGAPANQSYALAQGAIAGAMDVLVRQGMTRAEAAAFVAAECKLLGITDRKGQRLAARQVQSWRHREGQDLPESAQALLDASRHVTAADLEGAKAIARGVLQAVRDAGLACRFSG